MTDIQTLKDKIEMLESDLSTIKEKLENANNNIQG